MCHINLRVWFHDVGLAGNGSYHWEINLPEIVSITWFILPKIYIQGEGWFVIWCTCIIFDLEPTDISSHVCDYVIFLIFSSARFYGHKYLCLLYRGGTYFITFIHGVDNASLLLLLTECLVHMLALSNSPGSMGWGALKSGWRISPNWTQTHLQKSLFYPNNLTGVWHMSMQWKCSLCVKGICWGHNFINLICLLLTAIWTYFEWWCFWRFDSIRSNTPWL